MLIHDRDQLIVSRHAWLKPERVRLTDCRLCSNVVVARCRLSTYGTRAFSVAGPVCWNALPDYLESSDVSFDSFKQQLKTITLL